MKSTDARLADCRFNSEEELPDLPSVDLTSINTDDLLNFYNSEQMLGADALIDMIKSEDNTDSCAEHLEQVPDLQTVDLGFNFDVTMNGDNNNWLFNPNLQKIFIKMNAVMSINLTFNPPKETLFLRAMIIYSNVNEMHLPVKRCANHRMNDNGANNDHILKCCNPHAHYTGNELGTLFKDRLAVVVPLATPKINDDGLASYSIGFEFACQNSCVSGINRKTTSIVFTLENQNFKILGKKAIQFKVCSCPKRDSDREMPQKRKPSGNESFPRGKKPKYTHTQTSNQYPGEIKTEPEDFDSSETEHSDNDLEMLKRYMPDRESLMYWLESGFNKVMGKMAEDKSKTPDFYLEYAERMQKLRKAASRSKQ